MHFIVCHCIIGGHETISYLQSKVVIGQVLIDDHGMWLTIHVSHRQSTPAAISS